MAAPREGALAGAFGAGREVVGREERELRCGEIYFRTSLRVCTEYEIILTGILLWLTLRATENAKKPNDVFLEGRVKQSRGHVHPAQRGGGTGTGTRQQHIQG